MTTKAQEAFLKSAPGKWFNPDGAHGYQCKDLPDSYCLALFGDWVNTIRPGNGKDVFDNANPVFFTKVRNDPRNAAQVPPRGSILSFAGTAAVPEGHTAITLAPGANAVSVLQMDGYRQVAAHVASLSYAGLIGWLVPKLKAEKPSQCIVTAGDTLWSIAVQFGVSVQGLVNVNPQLKNPNLLRIGQVLTLP